MTVTLKQLRDKQAEHKATLSAYNAKKAQQKALLEQYQAVTNELETMEAAAKWAISDLRQMGAEFALQIEDDYTPAIPGTEQVGDPAWTPEDSHPQLDPSDMNQFNPSDPFGGMYNF